jgi:hypothetical protein
MSDLTEEELRATSKRYVSGPGRMLTRGARAALECLRLREEVSALREQHKRMLTGMALLSARVGGGLSGPEWEALEQEAVRIDDLLEREGAILEAERKRKEGESALPEAVRRFRERTVAYGLSRCSALALKHAEELLEWLRTARLTAAPSVASRRAAVAKAVLVTLMRNDDACLVCRHGAPVHLDGCAMATYLRMSEADNGE